MKLTLRNARREFTKLLPRLVGAYESGRLVPFIGSGMSAGACTSWPEFIARLERRAFPDRRPTSVARGDSAHLVERANRAVRRLRSRRRGEFETAMRYALVARANSIPSQTSALAELWWPLVLSTNYDNCYVAAFRKRFPDELHDVVGRSSEDCQRVLTSLSNPGRALLWALQGHLGVPSKIARYRARPELAEQLVVGHEEYRRVTYRDLPFRRAFAEVFRQRSLLFLGAGIRETYLQELFGEVIEIFGPSSRPHYALMPAGEVDPEFMLARFQIRVVEFPAGEYDEVQGWLTDFVSEVAARTQRPVAWSWGGVRGRARNGWHSQPSFEIRRDVLPARRQPGACLAVSAGGSGADFHFSVGIRALVQRWTNDRELAPTRRSPFVGEFSGRDVFAVRARAPSGERSLTAVYDAALSLFGFAGTRYERIHMQLPATGGTDKLEVSRRVFGKQVFPARFSLIQTVRAWRAWRTRHAQATCVLTLHVVAESVTMEIAAGRLDPLELLSCDDIRFSTEVVRDDGRIERRVFEKPPESTRLEEVVSALDLAPAHWMVTVSPQPSLEHDYEPETAVARASRHSLHELGVVPGSTLHFRRRARGRSASTARA